MKKKEIFIIAAVILCFIVVAIVVATTGASNGGNNYVRLEINPKMEFIVTKGKVVSYRAVNKEAKELLSQEEILGLSMEEATEKFLELSAQAGYLDVDGENNAIKMTVISGLTQEDDVKVFRAAQKFLSKHEILGVIVQNDSDMEVFKAAKKDKVSPDKYALIKSAQELYPDKKDDELKKLSCKKLIELIKEGQNADSKEYTEEDLINKTKLIDFNRVKYEKHEEGITKESGREFGKKLKKFQEENLTAYEVEFSKKYDEWKNK